MVEPILRFVLEHAEAFILAFISMLIIVAIRSLDRLLDVAVEFCDQLEREALKTESKADDVAAKVLGIIARAFRTAVRKTLRKDEQ